MSVRSLNKVMLIGNLTRDPETRYTGNGTAVTTFGLATNKSWKDADGNAQESTQFHNLVAWNKMAEICQQLLAKGMKIYVEGELNTRSWEGEDGQTKYKTEIRISDMILLDSKGKSGGAGGAANDNGAAASDDNGGASSSAPADDFADEPAADTDPIEDDLPF
ncbi:MAG: single-stranded DNA-binding protein [Candidatus Dojkabacteria bacterium]|nr:MAG: single-stranded DNA-binding protein [Candidatus Dojkabacteria bacterium]